MKNEQKDQLLPSASLVQNGLLSAALSVEEGNKLIAKFMKINVADFVWNEHLGLVHCDEYGDFQIDEDLQYYSPHANWNDLMSVVEKIEMLHWNDRNNQFNPPLEFFLQNEIEFVWNHVVKFLKWYNLNAVPTDAQNIF